MTTVRELKSEFTELFTLVDAQIGEIEDSLLLEKGRLGYVRAFIQQQPREFLKRVRTLRQYMTTNLKAANRMGQPLDKKYKKHMFKPMTLEQRISVTNELLFGERSTVINATAFVIATDTTQVFEGIISSLKAIEGYYLRCMAIPAEIKAEQEAIKTVAA